MRFTNFVMQIRKATSNDLSELYEIGKNTPELRVSSTEDFMDEDEFRWSIENSKGIFLIAQQGNKIIGFIYANAKDSDRPFKNKYACLVYLVVLPSHRRNGIATKLYSECEKQLKKLGITHIYGWANLESSGIIDFMKNHKYKEGKRFVWMNKKL